ncbi:MAG: GDSL-type esterase/lipase family protein [Oscillospiraceae bacterium]|nr:GDSL-type esterase/lipase family protein [Oscillospiraceae bacterium]
MKRTVKAMALALAMALILGAGGFAAIAEEKQPVYVALGDSIAAGTGLKNAEAACYGAIIANTNGYEFLNYGVGGHRTADLIARLEAEEVSADVARADIISVSIGGNDFLLGDMYRMMSDAWVRGDYAYMDGVIESIFVNFGEIIAKIKALNPEALLLVQTLYNPEATYKREVYQAGLDKLNGGYARYLEEHPGSYTIVNAGAAVTPQEKMIAKDHIHPNAKGHVAIAKAYLPVLAELGYGTAAEPAAAESGRDMNLLLFALRLMMPGIYLYIALSNVARSLFA